MSSSKSKASNIMPSVFVVRDIGCILYEYSSVVPNFIYDIKFSSKKVSWSMVSVLLFSNTSTLKYFERTW